MMNHSSKLLVLVALCLLVPLAVLEAEGVVRLSGLPFEPPDNTSTQVYINALYRFAIGIAAMLAVIKLIFAGVQYILSDVVTSKESAKNDIKTALLGLLVVLSAVLILTTINPQLTNLAALDELDSVALQSLPDTRQPNQFVPGNNFVVDSRECRDRGGELNLIYDPATGQNRAECQTGAGDDTDPVAVGGINFDQTRVYSDAERDAIIAQIEAEFPDSQITYIAAVSNDASKITEIQNNISQCELYGWDVYRLNSQVAPNITDVQIICIP